MVRETLGENVGFSFLAPSASPFEAEWSVWVDIGKMKKRIARRSLTSNDSDSSQDPYGPSTSAFVLS